MRNLNTEELKLVYGGCAPKPPKCKGASRSGGSKSHGSKSHGTKSHGSKSHGTKSGSKSCK